MRSIGFAMFALAWAVFAQTNQVVELKGIVSPQSGGTNLQFRAESGAVFELARESAPLFADTNLHHRLLLVKGRVHQAGPAFEVEGNIHAIREGKLYELFYYCDVCAVTTSYPGPCVCCREPVVLQEKESKKTLPH